MLGPIARRLEHGAYKKYFKLMVCGARVCDVFRRNAADGESVMLTLWWWAVRDLWMNDLRLPYGVFVVF